MNLPPLTPAIIMSLRIAASPRRHTTGGVNIGVPYILYLPADQTFCLHAYGAPQTTSHDLLALGELCRQERAEPGFIRWALDSADPPDLAALDPAARVLARARSREEAAKREHYSREQAAVDREAASRLRYVPKPDINSLTLDDL